MKKEIQKKLKVGTKKSDRKSVDRLSVGNLSSADLTDVAGSNEVNPKPSAGNDIFTSITSIFSFR